jgi:predicted nucleotidyltransferase
MNINDVVKQEEYKFLTENPRLGSNIMFLTFGGSHSYGTNIEGSDVDIRGCALPLAQDLIGLSSFEQVINNETDTTIYEFNKLVGLMSNCNPNTIEMLGCKPEHYIFYNDFGRQLVENRKMFLSQKAIYAFGGYANQQLRRLQNALARDSYPQSEKERHILGSCMNMMTTFNEAYQEIPEGGFELFIDKSNQEELEEEIFVNVRLDHYPLRDYKNIWSNLNNVVKEYGKLGKRNTKKDDLHLNKHAMHLVRLYLMCLDILEKGDIITFQTVYHELLMEIRNGKFQNEDGTFDSAFFDLVNELEKKLAYARENTSLPEKPNYKHIEEFVMAVNKSVVLGG